MTESAGDRTPIDQALDVLVYAPIGLLLDGRSVVRDLAERGRSHAVGARMVGQFALAQGQREARADHQPSRRSGHDPAR